MLCRSSPPSCGDGAGIGHRRAGHHRQIVAAGALQHVRQRQEGQELVLLVDVDQLRPRVGVAEDVAMTEHHALGPPGGAGGVDDGGQSRPGRRRAGAPRFRVGRTPAASRGDAPTRGSAAAARWAASACSISTTRRGQGCSPITSASRFQRWASWITSSLTRRLAGCRRHCRRGRRCTAAP
jgi:hypothetical protein